MTAIAPDPRVVEHIQNAGVREHAAVGYASLVREAHQALNDGGVGSDARRQWIVPGRIEVLGKHVDYAGGRSLLCAVERGFAVVARPRVERSIVVRDATRREAIAMPIDVRSPTPTGPPWNVYLSTVTRRLVRNFGSEVLGCDIAIASNLAPAAGVSSSSALVVGLVLAISSVSELESQMSWRAVLPDRLALAGYLGALENGADFGPLTGQAGVGTLGGAQDQTAILCSAANQLGVFAWAPVRHERWVTWPDDMSFVIGVSGVLAAKAGAVREKYNRASRTVRHLVASWNSTTGRSDRTLGDAFASAPDAAAQLDAIAMAMSTPEFSVAHLRARLSQFSRETYELVPQAAQALADDDLSSFAARVAESQIGAEQALENQIPETVGLVRTALQHGAIASSAFGAGFGGSVWSMVPDRDVDAFTARWRGAYQKLSPSHASRSQFFSTKPAPPAFELALEL